MFLKKITLFACLAILTMAFSSSLLAQEIDLDSVTDEQMSKEAPLTQADIDLYIKFSEYSQEMFKKLETDPQLDIKQALVNFVKANNLTPVRMKFITLKIPYIILIVTNKMPENPELSHLKPTESEKTIVQDNMTKILATIQKGL
ncbi:MAG: hypothetical protein LBR11_11325 [Deltaproteobacteria bacterium]|jgi:fucose permease|nr:hypothetical protein [Deltaproteobacteria bacterium]